MIRRLPLLLVAALACPLSAQSQILPYLPKDTLVAVEVPDLDTTIKDFRSMPLAKIWHEEEVQQFVQDAMDRAKGHIDMLLARARQMHEQGAFPVDPDKLLGLRVKSGTFALTRLDLVKGRYSPQPSLGMVLHLDFGDTAKEWFGLAQLGLGMLEQHGGSQVTKSQSKVGDIDLITLAPARANESPMALCVAMVGSGIVIGTLEEDMRALLENLQKQTPVLTATESYRASASRLTGAGSEMRMFARVDPMLDFALKAINMAAETQGDLPIDPDGVARAIDALGLRSIHSVGYSSSFTDGRCVSTGYTASPAPERKGLLSGNVKNLDLGFLLWVPKDAVSFRAMTLDPMGIYDGLVGALKAYDPQVAEMALGRLAAVEKQVGFTLRDDLFGAIGDSFIHWSMPLGTITSAPEMAFLLKVNDQDRLIKVMKNLSAMTNGMVEIEEGEKRGIKAYQVRVNMDPSGGMGMNPFDIFSPTFSFKNGYMIAGFSASDVKRVFDRMDRADEPKGDIRGNKEFAPYLAKLPSELQSLSFSDWKAEFEGYYQMITGVLAFVPISEDVPLDMSLLPDSNTITKHLFGSVAYTQADAQGYASTSIGPFGPEMFMLLAGLVGAGVAVAANMRGF